MATETLTRAERSRRTQELLLQAHGTEDETTRTQLLDEVVLINRGVAEAVANRYRGRGVATEDLHQAAYEGLIKAVRKFDPSIRADLLSYAVPTIRGEVQRWFRDQSWMVRPPRRLQELQWQIRRSTDRLSQDLGREPAHEEVQKDAGCTAREHEEALQAHGCFQPRSLDRPTMTGSSETLGDQLLAQDTDADQDAAEARAILARVMPSLPERDRRIIELRFFQEWNQRAIGDELGVTQVQVSRLIERILRDLRVRVA